MKYNEKVTYLVSFIISQMTFKAQSRLIILLVSLGSFTLILFNYYSSKLKSGIRAYINGESDYSKGHKDALLNLTYYLDNEDNFYWERYRAALKVPESDNKAAHAMMNNEPDTIVFKHFLNGRIHPEDINNIVWVFRNFRNYDQFKHAVDLWSRSEVILIDLNRSATKFKLLRDKGLGSAEKKSELVSEISNSNLMLTRLEIDFSRTLSGIARKIERVLKWVNVFLTIIIVGSLSAYLLWVIAKLYKSRSELKASYDRVFQLNSELDTFVYSLSHDLRAPLTSLQGLVSIAAAETDINSMKENINLMDTLLHKQDLFIKDVISLLQRRNLSPQPEIINLKALISDAIALNVHHIESLGMKTEIDIEEGLEEIYNDIVFVKIIVNNLVSNAFKYSDPKKEERYVKVCVKGGSNQIKLDIEDNGIGIAKEFQEKVFEMFYILNANKRGTGLGLYIIKQAVEKLGGSIHLDSILGNGSKFTISLPKLD
jgi:signal transduction histidine kinase